jgi:hypothetical protein
MCKSGTLVSPAKFSVAAYATNTSSYDEVPAAYVERRKQDQGRRIRPSCNNAPGAPGKNVAQDPTHDCEFMEKKTYPAFSFNFLK